MDQRDRIDKGVAAILSFGNYDGGRPNRDLNTINHDSSHGVHGQGKVAFGMTTLGPPPGGKLPGFWLVTLPRLIASAVVVELLYRNHNSS